MFNEQRSKLLEKYQNLTDSDKAVMQFLVVCHTYETASFIAQNLSNLSIRSDQGRPITAASIQPVLVALKNNRLLEVQAGKSGYRCNRLLAEPITRQLVEDKQFERYASLFDQPTPIAKKAFYANQHQCLRDARISFHRGDYASVNQCLRIGNRYYYQYQLPDPIDVYLSWILNPLDIAWLKRRHPQMIDDLTGFIALHQLVYLYHDPDIFNFLANTLRETQKLYN